MEGWMNFNKDGQVGRRTKGWTDGWKDGRTLIQTDGEGRANGVLMSPAAHAATVIAADVSLCIIL